MHLLKQLLKLKLQLLRNLRPQPIENEVVNPNLSTLTIENKGGGGGFNPGFDNSYGYYILDDQGNPSEGQIIWADVDDNIGQTFSMDGLDPDKVGFFLIPNGDNLNSLKDGQEVTFEKDKNGNWDPVFDGKSIEGYVGVTLFSDTSFNKDGNDYAKDSSASGNQNWEEIIGRGDLDYNDANMQVSWSTPEVVEEPVDNQQPSVEPTSDIAPATDEVQTTEPEQPVAVENIPGSVNAPDGPTSVDTEKTTTTVSEDPQSTDQNAGEIPLSAPEIAPEEVVSAPVNVDNPTVGELPVAEEITLDSAVDENVPVDTSASNSENEEVATMPVDVGVSEPEAEAVNVSASTLTVENKGGFAGYDSSYGFYELDDQGNPSKGQIIWADVKENVGESFSMEGLDPDKVGFFLIPNGDNINQGLKDGQEVTFEKDENGNWDPIIGDKSIEGAKGVTLFSDTSLNKDGYEYAVDNAADGNQNWEDLLGGGDKDSDDVNMNVTWSTPEVVQTDNDILHGGAGDDIVFAGTGDDVATGGSGDDWVEGEAGDDKVHGGSGDDVVGGGTGDDVVTWRNRK
jgi:hypothetical protein